MDQSSEEPEPAAKRRRKAPEQGSEVDALSMKSDRSNPTGLSERPESDSQSGVSAVSLKSDWSKLDPPVFSEGPGPGLGPGRGLASQSGVSAVSLKSDRSKSHPLFFSEEPKPGPGPGPGLASQSGVSAVSFKSDWSKLDPPVFSPGPKSGPGPGLASHRDQSLEDLSEQTQLDAIFRRLEEEMVAFVKQQLQSFHKLLTSEKTPGSPTKSASEEEEWSRQAVLNITLFFLRRMDQEPLAQRLRKGSVGVCRDDLKSHLQYRYSQVLEGVVKAGGSAPLLQIFTDLNIVEGGASELHQEHEVIHLENASRRPAERAITCEEIFKQRPESEKPIRTVLTRGVAGVGKTLLTQKFILDWAEGRAHQDIQLLFPFTFRALNLLKARSFSLVQLIHHFFSQTKDLCSFEGLQVLFIFDGLEESRLSLDFTQTKALSDPTESASVEELLVNLIRGDLLPSARLWITTNPASANQIPAWCVSMVTEVRGFTDEQKEQYFMKRIKDKRQAIAVISHIKSIRSLYIMSSMPIFCWILSTVLQEKPELPKTLTQMYIHFLVVKAKVKNIKYHDASGADLHWTPETKEMVRSLGKLAFEQLLKGNLIFYESDLRESGLDAAEIARFSGVFTQVFREEPGLYQDKVYCFVHLSVQEFLAALYVHQTFFSSGLNLLSCSSESPGVFYRSAVDQASLSPNGHLDLFLRFLLGLSLPTNQRLLQGLLTQTGSERTNQETVKYIKQKLNEEGVSAERSLNLFHCLNELNDQDLFLLSSDSDLEEFDLRKSCSSDKGLLDLLPVVKAFTKATVSCCGLTALSCGPLASVLSSSSLTQLDLSNNDLQDLGVEQLCEGLKSALCRLVILRLSGCLVSERGGASLAAALSSAPSTLTELDLSYNHPGSSTELLTALRAPQGPLQMLRLDPSGERWMVPGLRKYACEFSLDPHTAHRRLLLSEDRRSVTRVEAEPEEEQEAEQQSPRHQERFTYWEQVLSSSGLRGRCYWELDWSGRRFVSVGVSYRGITRLGRNCGFGANDQSWGLWISDGECFVLHDSRITGVPGRVDRASGTVGVFLDWEGGALTFYEVLSGGGLHHLHTFSTSFTEDLFPGFRVDSGCSVSLVKL